MTKSTSSASTTQTNTRHSGNTWVVKLNLEREVEIKQLKRKLNSYAELPYDWDGEGSQTPSRQAIDDALKFLTHIPSGLPLPYPEAGPEGDVGIYWDNQKAKTFVHVLFEGDGHFAYIANVKHTQTDLEEKYGGEALSVDDPWPTDLVKVLLHK